jgi:aminoglycoside phosphotransferase (APT) family kinase protein
VIDNYLACGIQVEGDKAFIKYIRDNQEIVLSRPSTFQHGDFHVGNLVYDGNTLGILDFNRCSIGDPYEEYDRYPFTFMNSPYFAYGQIKGHVGDPDDTFFKLIALYQALNALASIPWAMSFSQEDVDNMLVNYNVLRKEYNDFRSYIPLWYNKIQGGLYEF